MSKARQWMFFFQQDVKNKAFSDEHQTYTIYCTSSITFDFAYFHLLPIVYWSPINFQQSLAVQPWAQLTPVLPHLVLRGTNNVMKTSAGF